MNFLFSLLSIPLFPFTAAARLRKRPGKLRLAQVDALWNGMSEGLFERNSAHLVSDRVDLALRTGCAQLGLTHALVTLQKGMSLEVHNLVSLGENTTGLSAGQVLERSAVFCGMMGSKRDFLAIDHASLSDWRKHRAHSELGWETYIGVSREIANGETLTVAFFQKRARDGLFQSSEKDFVEQLGHWIAAIVQREVMAPIPAETAYRSEAARI